MIVEETELEGLIVIKPKVFGDPRGYFFELWNSARFAETNLNLSFKQDNISFSGKGILRGLHFQNPHSQGKLVTVLRGAVYDVVVDLRQSSKTFGKSLGIELSEENHKQLYVPEGFAHGFVTLTEDVLFAYKCTETYHPECEHSLLWNDPDLGIKWPIDGPKLSAKDAAGIKLRDFSPKLLFK